MWVIDEYAIIDRIWDWFIPIIPPIRAFIAARVANTEGRGLCTMKQIINSGASFCHVDKIRHEIHEIEDMTAGYQVWHGAAPSFNIKDIKSTVGNVNDGSLIVSHRDILLINISLEPNACARKYLIAASVSLLEFV